MVFIFTAACVLFLFCGRGLAECRFSENSSRAGLTSFNNSSDCVVTSRSTVVKCVESVSTVYKPENGIKYTCVYNETPHLPQSHGHVYSLAGNTPLLGNLGNIYMYRNGVEEHNTPDSRIHTLSGRIQGLGDDLREDIKRYVNSYMRENDYKKTEYKTLTQNKTVHGYVTVTREKVVNNTVIQTRTETSYRTSYKPFFRVSVSTSTVVHNLTHNRTLYVMHPNKKTVTSFSTRSILLEQTLTSYIPVTRTYEKTAVVTKTTTEVLTKNIVNTTTVSKPAYYPVYIPKKETLIKPISYVITKYVTRIKKEPRYSQRTGTHRLLDTSRNSIPYETQNMTVKPLHTPEATSKSSTYVPYTPIGYNKKNLSYNNASSNASEYTNHPSYTHRKGLKREINVPDDTDAVSQKRRLCLNKRLNFSSLFEDLNEIREFNEFLSLLSTRGHLKRKINQTTSPTGAVTCTPSANITPTKSLISENHLQNISCVPQKNNEKQVILRWNDTIGESSKNECVRTSEMTPTKDKTTVFSTKTQIVLVTSPCYNPVTFSKEPQISLWDKFYQDGSFANRYDNRPIRNLFVDNRQAMQELSPVTTTITETVDLGDLSVSTLDMEEEYTYTPIHRYSIPDPVNITSQTSIPEQSTDVSHSSLNTLDSKSHLAHKTFSRYIPVYRSLYVPVYLSSPLVRPEKTIIDTGKSDKVNNILKCCPSVVRHGEPNRHYTDCTSQDKTSIIFTTTISACEEDQCHYQRNTDQFSKPPPVRIYNARRPVVSLGSRILNLEQFSSFVSTPTLGTVCEISGVRIADSISHGPQTHYQPTSTLRIPSVYTFTSFEDNVVTVDP